MAPTIDSLISPDAAERLRREIASVSGNEVFFEGSVEDGVVTAVRPLARGNGRAVPAAAATVRPGSVVIHNHPGGTLTPSEADIEVASRLAERAVGFYIIDNDASRVYVVVEAAAQGRPRPVEAAELKAVLGPGGAVARTLEGYEHRPQQLSMAAATAAAFGSDAAALIEAATGVGKSFGYLVPSIIWATENKEQVVVSTNTINLQEQLIGRDLPLLESAMPGSFSYVLAKGRSNYVCLRKAAELEAAPQFFEDTAGLEGLLRWISRTRDGSLTELPFTPEPALWDAVASETDTCLKLRCRHYRRCFFYEARRAAAAADIVVVNHHLLFADLAIKHARGTFAEAGALPPFERLVIDEAHRIEEIATEHFGESVGGAAVARATGRLVSARNPKKGLIALFCAKLRRWLEMPELSALLASLADETAPLVEQARLAGAEAFALLHHFALSLDTEGSGRTRLRLTGELRSRAGWDDVEEALGRCSALLKRLSRELKSAARTTAKAAEERRELDEELGSMEVEVSAMASRTAALAAAVEAALGPCPEGYVQWIEATAPARGPVPRARLNVSPVDVGSALREALFDTMRSVVMTSATLTVKGGFEYTARRLGLDRCGGRRTVEERFDSPFDYERNVLLAAATDMADPRDEDYAGALAAALAPLIRASGGGALVLFTSHALLDETYSALERTSAGEFTLLRQGARPQRRLIERFRREIDSVLLATSSFWEGVDVPGPSLRHVIITRLPFEVPDDPVFQARCEMLAGAGKDPFVHYMLPRAVLRLRQGFGRLVRCRTDRGVVTILDSRLASRSYGRAFTASLPRCRRAFGPIERIEAEIRAFFDRPSRTERRTCRHDGQGG